MNPELIEPILREFTQGRREHGMDLLYDSLDELLLTKDFDSVRAFLEKASRVVSSLPVSISLGILTVTLPWQVTLGESRVHFGDALRTYLISARGEESTKRLMSGLE